MTRFIRRINSGDTYQLKTGSRNEARGIKTRNEEKKTCYALPVGGSKNRE
jgi:hypothetical protein